MEDTEERLLGSRPLNGLLRCLHRKQLGGSRAQLLLGGGLAAGVCLWQKRQTLGQTQHGRTHPRCHSSRGQWSPSSA